MTDNNIAAIPYINTLLYKGSEYSLSIASLIAFIGGRHVVSDLYKHRQDLLCNPLVKIVILYSIIYMSIKDAKLATILFFVYIFTIDNYVTDECSPEFFNGSQKTPT